MTLEMGKSLGNDFTALQDLIAATPGQRVAAVVKIVAYHDRESSQVKLGVGQVPKENFPVTADVLICGNGPRAGEALLGERFLNNAVTETLRGVKNPKSPLEPVQPPRSPNTRLPWGPGTEIGVVFSIGEFGSTKYLKADEPGAGDATEITTTYATGQGWKNAEIKAAQIAAQQVQQFAAAPAPAAPAAPSALELSTPAAPAIDPAVAAWQAQQAAAAVPPAQVAPTPAPAPPAGVPADLAEEFAKWQLAQQGLTAPPVGGLPAARSWS